MAVTFPKRFVKCMEHPTEAPLPVVTNGAYPYPDYRCSARDIPVLLGHSVDAAVTAITRVPCAPGLAAAGAARRALQSDHLPAVKVVPYAAAGLVGGTAIGLAGAVVSTGDAGLALAGAGLTSVKVGGSYALQGMEIAARYTLVPALHGIAIAVGAAAHLLEEVFT